MFAAPTPFCALPSSVLPSLDVFPSSIVRPRQQQPLRVPTFGTQRAFQSTSANLSKASDNEGE
ncbi:hypothetical protein EV182_002557, partial [Spiromyces aspiralis]